jgi:hypothetical protein
VEPALALSRQAGLHQRGEAAELCLSRGASAAEAETIARFGCTPGTFRGAGDEGSIRQRLALASGSAKNRE